jgi:hypothetical protein
LRWGGCGANDDSPLHPPAAPVTMVYMKFSSKPRFFNRPTAGETQVFKCTVKAGKESRNGNVKSRNFFQHGEHGDTESTEKMRGIGRSAGRRQEHARRWCRGESSFALQPLRRNAPQIFPFSPRGRRWPEGPDEGEQPQKIRQTNGVPP